MHASKRKWESTVTLTVAHHCKCVCGEGRRCQYSVAARENNVTKCLGTWIIRLNEPEFVDLLFAIASLISPGRSYLSDLFGPWDEIEDEDNQYTFQLERNKPGELGAFGLQINGQGFENTVPLDEPQLLEFMVLALGLKFKETLFPGCMQGGRFHTLKKFPPR